MAQKNLLLYLGKTGFGESDGDGILLEDSATDNIILDGIEPLPANVFMVQEDLIDQLVGDLSVSFTAFGDAAISSAQSKFGGTSLALDGTQDRIQSTAITLGTDDYTWETFAYFNSLGSTQAIWDAGQNVGASQNPVVYITSTNLQLSYGGGTYINAAHGMSTGQFHHIAIVRNGTQLQAFIDGVSIGTATYTLGAGATLHTIGGNFAGSFTMNGFLDETRLTRRVIYTGNFTPPTSEFNTGNENDIFIMHYDGTPGSNVIPNTLGTERVTGGDNFILETATAGQDTGRILNENSLITFTSEQVHSVGDKLLSDNPVNDETLLINDYRDVRIADIIRQSKILLEEPSEIREIDYLNNIILELDGVSPLKTEDGFFIVQEQPEDGLNPNRNLTAGQGNIDSGSDDQDAIALEDDGFIVLDGTDALGTDENSRLIDETGDSFIREEAGVIVQEDYSTDSYKASILTEDAVPGLRMRLEQTLQPDVQDGIQLEEGSQELPSDRIAKEDSGSILTEINDDDRDNIIENVLLEEATLFFEYGQIPAENYSLSFSQDRPGDVVATGQQPLAISSIITLTKS